MAIEKHLSALYQQLPAIDKLLKQPEGSQLVEQFGHTAVVASCRKILQQARKKIKNDQILPHFCQTDSLFLAYLTECLQAQRRLKMQPIHNLTGTVLHTNLGRAIWAESAQQAALQAMQQPVALEFNLNEGVRGQRDQFISQLLTELTGAEAACVVNNNAAAVLLILATFAKEKEVILSRGELIEIGGAFRIPDIMQQAGCQLKEVGTTNRTHLTDYANAINDNTALLMKVHTSNYEIIGFTKSVDESELVALAQQRQIPVVSDLGSGALINLTQYALPNEPTVQDKIKQGVDLVCFSGDKLLGGPQAGIIVGKKALIEQLQKHPLKRALRCDKVILSGLEATLRLYLEPEKLTSTLPTLRNLIFSLDTLQQRVEALYTRLQHKLSAHYLLEKVESYAQIGSGAQPNAKIPSLAITIQPRSAKNSDLVVLQQRLKQLPTPIIGRVEADKLWLDCRSAVNFQQILQDVEHL